MCEGTATSVVDRNNCHTTENVTTASITSAMFYNTIAAPGEAEKTPMVTTTISGQRNSDHVNMDRQGKQCFVHHWEGCQCNLENEQCHLQHWEDFCRCGSDLQDDISRIKKKRRSKGGQPASVNYAGRKSQSLLNDSSACLTMWCNLKRNLTSYKPTNVLLLLLLIFASHPSRVSSQANAPLEYHLVEEQPADSFVGNLIQDLSLDTQYSQDELDQMRFTISSNTGEANLEYFSIDTVGGIIKTTRSVDREEICFSSVECSVNLKIVVSPAQFFQVIKVIVHITDRNDHVPTFPQPLFSKSIPETTTPGAAFPLPIADDYDSGIFGVQRYRLDGDRSKFRLRVTNSSDGLIEDIRLLLVQSLDREAQESYAMRVVASDGGSPPESGTMSILITVTDTNDNNPKFDNDTYEVVIPENTASHTTIIQVHASDPDSGFNGEVIYGFADDTLNKYGDLFEIDRLTGEIYLSRVVDYEEGEIYYLSAVARDRGDNSLPAFARVVVKVRDVNDHAPYITLNFLEEDQEIASVMENSNIGTFVAHVSVSDPDGGEMGKITCSMQSPYFQLQQLGTSQNEYKIVTRVVFDREVRGSYEISVSCKDKGDPPMEAIEIVPIFIIDANDHQPQFAHSLYVAKLLENNEMNGFIARLNATDGDSDGNAAIKYELSDVKDKRLVYVDPINGIVTAKTIFDYERQDQYSFEIIAYDQGEPSRTATSTLSLSIIDMNDEPPKFEEPSYVFTVLENQPANEEVGEVKAVDRDSSPFNNVIYSIGSNSKDVNETFKIDTLTGKISTRSELDREKKPEYRFNVKAENSGFQDMTSTVEVTVTIGDENDNPPILDFPNSYNNTIQVAVLVPKGRVIAQARAHDPDLGSNGEVVYSLENHNNTFKIDPKNGYITVEAKLTEVEYKVCKMWVVVKDKGQKPRSSREEVSIILAAGFGQSSSHKSAAVYLSPTELIIICAVGSSVVLIIVVVIIIFTVKRCDKNKQKKQQYVAGTHHDNSVEPEESSTASRCSDCCSPGHIGGGGIGGGGGLGGIGEQLKSSQNGQCGKNGGDRPKKEVKFLMDNSGTHTGESSTDDFPPSWPTHIGSELIQNPKAHSTALGSSDSSEVQDDDKLGPLWHDQPGPWNQSNHHRSPAGASGALPVPPPPPPPATCITRSSPIAPLTEMELEMHEMLQMFGRDKDSETGSFTDSGRGPSEEGDTRPSPLDPKLNDDHKGATLRCGDHPQRGIGNHYRPSDSTMGRRLNALPKSSSFGTAPGMKNFSLHDRSAHPTIHGVKPPMYNTSYIPVPSVDKVHRMQHQHSTDSAGSGSESGATWSDTARLTNNRSPSKVNGNQQTLPARTGILKFAHTNRRPHEQQNGSRTLPHKSGSLDSGIQGGPDSNRQHIPMPNTFQGPYHGNIDKQRSQPSSASGSRAGSSQSLNVNAQSIPMQGHIQGHPNQGQGLPNRNNFYPNHCRTLSPSHRTSSLQSAPHSSMDNDNKSRSPKLDRLSGATSKVHPSKGLYDNPMKYGAKTADWGNESVMSDDGRSTCASTTSGSYMVEPDSISQDTRSSFRDDKERTHQTMV